MLDRSESGKGSECLNENEAITFTAEVAQVKTLADHGLRIVLDIPDNAVDVVSKMIEIRQTGAFLECVCLAIKPAEIQPKEKQENVRFRKYPTYAKTHS